MTRNGTADPFVTAAPRRVDWVDYAKGICIILVVMMHSVLGVENAVGQTGFMHYVVEFARPFRMPDFFLISGLFLAVVIDRDWRTYLDRKVVHFAYFYVLWLTIQFGFKAPSFAAEWGWAEVGRQYLLAFIEPFGTLWFIYLLPIFFVVTKATATRSAAGDLAGRRRAAERACRHRLDRDRRILRALRVFLFRLSVCRKSVRAVGLRPRAAWLRRGRAGAVGRRQRRTGPCRTRRLAYRLARAGFRGRLRHHRHRNAAGADAVAERCCASAASIRS